MDGPSNIEVEVALLKQRADQTDQRLDRIEHKLDRVADRIEGLIGAVVGLPTKDDVKRVESAAWNALGVGAAIALTVLGIVIALLAYLQDRQLSTRPEPPQASAPAPIILQLPPWPTAPTPPAPAAPPG